MDDEDEGEDEVEEEDEGEEEDKGEREDEGEEDDKDEGEDGDVDEEKGEDEDEDEVRTRWQRGILSSVSCQAGCHLSVNHCHLSVVKLVVICQSVAICQLSCWLPFVSEKLSLLLYSRTIVIRWNLIVQRRLCKA